MHDLRVVRVDRIEFELSNGKVFSHLEELKEDPDLEKFDETYQYWRDTIEASLDLDQ